MYNVYTFNMLSTRVKSPIISVMFYFCVVEVKYRKQNLSFKPLDEQSICEVFQYKSMFLLTDWYICAAQGLKMGGLGSGPSLKMRGFQSGPSREKQGILELKITKKRIYF